MKGIDDDDVPRVSTNEFKLLEALCKGAELSGIDLHRESGVSQSSIYAILNRMEDTKRVIKSRPEILGSRRRLYRITSLGQRAYRAALSR